LYLKICYIIYKFKRGKATASHKIEAGMSALQEKRHFPRVNLKTPLVYKIRGLPQSDNGICEDISAGGIGFINDVFMAPATLLSLGINVLSRTLNPTAKVAWSQPLPHSDRYKVGVEFLEFDPVEKRYLSDYIDMQTAPA
jgi:hypothetical protein